MEDPVTFDIWALVDPEHKPEAGSILGRMRPALDRAGILKAIVESTSRERAILVGEQLGWGSAQTSRRDLDGAFTNVRLFQSGYGPDDLPNLKLCAAHSLNYAGVLGCPVCGKRYAER
jgi:hypothetical protein